MSLEYKIVQEFAWMGLQLGANWCICVFKVGIFCLYEIHIQENLSIDRINGKISSCPNLFKSTCVW